MGNSAALGTTVALPKSMWWVCTAWIVLGDRWLGGQPKGGKPTPLHFLDKMMI